MLWFLSLRAVLDGGYRSRVVCRDPVPHGVIAVGIVGAARIYRESLASALAAQPGIEVVGTAATWSEAFGVLIRQAPQVLLVDAGRGLTFGGLRMLDRVAPDVRVVALALAADERAALTCLESGVSGYVADEASLTDLVGTIERTADGELLCSPRVAAALGRRIADLAAQRATAGANVTLTSRELEVLHLIERHLSNREIATRLCIEVATVKNHVHNILVKLGVSRRAAAADWARSVGAAGLGASANDQLALRNSHPVAD
jgi:two-component system, NarL family, nitrate/nitrite response regulator NarL